MSGSRVKVGAWVIAEDRNRAFDQRGKTDNPLQERTRIAVPLLTVDVRVTERVGVQAAASVPDVTRSASVRTTAGSTRVSETFSGLGDTSIVGWYKLRATASAQASRPRPMSAWRANSGITA